MTKIIVNFHDHGPINIQLEQSQTAELFLKLFTKNLTKEKPVWRDPMRYTMTYFQQLCQEIKDKLGWDWDMKEFSIENTVTFHKDIENFLEKEQSFRKVPGELQNLLHEAHFCIHNIEHMDRENPRGASIQFEWFNDDYIALPEDKKFNHQINVGDIVLQNPYVGHPPIQCWQMNDYKNIARTCAYHDRILPGLKINIQKGAKIDIDQYKEWWKNNCNDFVVKEGMEKILKYTGFPVIGKVNNIDYLNDIITEESLTLEDITIA